jgi:hypothetical protein
LALLSAKPVRDWYSLQTPSLESSHKNTAPADFKPFPFSLPPIWQRSTKILHVSDTCAYSIHRFREVGT